MSDIISGELIQVARDLVMLGIGCLAYKLTRESAQLRGRFGALARGAAWCIGFGLLAAVLLGSPSCDGDFDWSGYCSGSDGYAPGMAARAAQLLYWVAFLSVPMVLGALSYRGDPLNPWAKPQRKFP